MSEGEVEAMVFGLCFGIDWGDTKGNGEFGGEATSTMFKKEKVDHTSLLSLLDGDQRVVGIFNQAAWRAQPPSYFLVRVGSLEVVAVLLRAPSSNSI